MSHKFITHSNDGDEIYVKTPYNEEFRDRLKQLVDRDSRRWDSAAKHWIIDSAYEESLEKLVRDYWGTGSRRPREPLRTRPTPPRESVWDYAESPPTKPPRVNFARPEVVYSVDDYVAKVAEEDVHHVIKELTAKVSALTYELDQVQLEAKAAQQIADRYRRVHTTDERTIAELRFKLSMAELKTPPHTSRYDEFIRGGKSANGEAAAYETLHLTPDAPPEVVKAAQRALAFLHHPDRGGDEEKMKKVNAAADQILGK